MEPYPNPGMRPLGYACVFLVLFAGFVGLDRVVDYFELVSLLPLFVGARSRR
jgi:hypothetical protein